MMKLQNEANADLSGDYMTETNTRVSKSDIKFKEPKVVYPHKKH
jgi:hypothetical protein